MKAHRIPKTVAWWIMGLGLPLCAVIFWLNIRASSIDSNRAAAVAAGQVVSGGESSWAKAAWADLLPDVANAQAAPPSTNPPSTNPPSTNPPSTNPDGTNAANSNPRNPNTAPSGPVRSGLRQKESEQWTSFMDFFKDHSPRRFLILSRQFPQANSPMRQRLLARWMTMQQIQANQPKLYGKMVEQFEVEDKLFGLAAELRQATRRGNAQRAAQATAEIRAEAANLVDLNLAERQLRLENSRRLLDQVEARLNQDQQNRDQTAQQRADQLVRQAAGTNSQNTAPIESPPADAAPVDGQ